MARSWLGRVLRALIFVVSSLCFAWVLWPVVRDGAELRASLETGALLRALAAGMPAYALVSVTLALAWWWVAGIYGARPPARQGYGVYARSQLAKYLPGNAFQYVSRQVLGRGAGLSHQALVASGLLELGSLVLAALLIGGLVSLLVRSTAVPGLVAWPFALALGLGSLVAWPGLDLLLRRLPFTAHFMEELPHLSLRRTLALLGPSLALHLLFFAGTGALLIGLVVSSGPVASGTVASGTVASGTVAAGEAWRLLWIYPVAWLAGTVAVGAPAGAGVREAILTLELEPLLGPAHAAAVALAFRLLTTGGDLLTAAFGWWVGVRSSRAPS